MIGASDTLGTVAVALVFGALVVGVWVSRWLEAREERRLADAAYAEDQRLREMQATVRARMGAAQPAAKLVSRFIHYYYCQAIVRTYPELEIRQARLHDQEGQFSNVLFVNEVLVFRFPRSRAMEEAMKREVQLLRQLQGRFALAIPEPVYEKLEGERLVFMGYRMIAGRPLRRDDLEAIQDEATLQRLARQVAGFLRELHTIPLDSLGLDLGTWPVGESRREWEERYAAFREKLYPYMRPDAQAEVSRNFETFLRDATNFDYAPVLRHGDFGPGNILYDLVAQVITGVIDFGFAGPGDAAQDAGALRSFGEDFFERCCGVYPELRGMVKRSDFYRSTYALQQALYALRDGNQADFEDGIQAYI